MGAHERHTCRVYEVTAKIGEGGMGLEQRIPTP